MKSSLTVLTLSATLSMGWVAFAQQNTTPTTAQNNMQTISCLDRTNQGNNQNNQTSAATTGTTTGGTTGTATTGTTGTMNNGTATTGTAGTTGTTTGTAGTTGATTTGTTGTTTGAAVPAVPATTGTATNSATNTGATASLSSLSTAEVCFLDQAARANLFEIQSSQVALQRSNSSAVKQLAQTIINDHQQLGNQLKALAANYNAMPPQQVNSDQQSLIAALKNLNGATFDATYIADQINAHAAAIALFRSYSQPANTADQNVRQLAAKGVPVLQQHLQSAQQIQKQLGSK